MAKRAPLRADRFVLAACVVGATAMTLITLGAADGGVGGSAPVLLFIALGLAPYGLTAALSLIRPLRRLVVWSTRAVAMLFGLFDCGLRYGALYHPTSSTDAIVVAILPFWWVPTLVVVTAATAAVLWLRGRLTGTPAFA